MRKPVMALLLLGGLSHGTGCIITSGDDDDGSFDVTWSLIDASGAPGACPGDTVEVVSRRAGGLEVIDLFDCVDGRGVTDPLPLGSYTVWVNVLDRGVLVAQSFATDLSLDLSGEVVPVSFELLTEEGFFGLSWNLTDDVNDLSCAEVGAGGVSVLSTLAGPDATGFDDIFDCTDFYGETAPLPLGDYTVVVSLLEEGTEAVLGESLPRNTSLDVGNQLNDLGNFDFVFAP